MAVPRTTLWEIQPHTRAKHRILKSYLDAWLPIMARYNGRILFIDGFAGPGRYSGGERGSPSFRSKRARNGSRLLLHRKRQETRRRLEGGNCSAEIGTPPASLGPVRSHRRQVCAELEPDARFSQGATRRHCAVLCLR